MFTAIYEVAVDLPGADADDVLPIDRLTESLGKVLEQFYPLAGRLIKSEKDKVARLFCNNEVAPFTHKRFDGVVSELMDVDQFEPRSLRLDFTTSTLLQRFLMHRGAYPHSSGDRFQVWNKMPKHKLESHSGRRLLRNSFPHIMGSDHSRRTNFGIAGSQSNTIGTRVYLWEIENAG
ncbi:hypothetical protein R1sor_020887 [Riccia sorocarpa]|uniref:Uncharacterized protein n=1 Tax=Riccia sorocarpa TaxID=122646 RepID=A0ABD3GGX6_9MARC